MYINFFHENGLSDIFYCIIFLKSLKKFWKTYLNIALAGSCVLLQSFLSSAHPSPAI